MRGSSGRLPMPGVLCAAAAAVALSLVLGLALGGWPAAPAAQEARKYGVVDTATVSAVDRESSRLAIHSAEGYRVFRVEPVTEILRAEDPIALDALEIGDRVVVEAHDELGDGKPELVADRIVVVVD